MTNHLTTTSVPAFSEAPVVVARAPATQEGRIRAALGLFRGPLPHAVAKWLIRYHDHLAAHLSLPFEARCPEESGVVRPWTSNVTVVALIAPSDQPALNGAGLKCKAIRSGVACEIPLVDLELEGNDLNAQLIEDYWYWFWNWQFDPKI